LADYFKGGINTELLSEILEEIDYLENSGKDERIILKWV
jgi:hypothetical protein